MVDLNDVPPPPKRKATRKKKAISADAAAKMRAIQRKKLTLKRSKEYLEYKEAELKAQLAAKNGTSEAEIEEKYVKPFEPPPPPEPKVAFKPNPGPQEDFLAANEREVLYGGPLTLDTDVLTPSGYVKMGHIKVGDTVFTHTGEQTTVVDIPFVGAEECYVVTFSDGTEVTASKKHKWLVGTTDWAKTQNEYRVRTTEDLVNCRQKSGAKKYYVPVASFVDFPSKAVLLDSYFLGAMLGDGCLTQRCNMTLTGIDHEIVEHIKLPYGYSAKRSSGTIQWKFTKGQYGGSKDRSSLIWDEIVRLGLAGTRSNTKFIPKEYLYNDFETRLALLQGLMDTDGTVRSAEERRGAELKFTTISPRLRDDFVLLAQSLGFVCWYKVEKAKSETYRIYLRGGSACPFRLSRKVNRWQAHASSLHNRKYITAVKPAGPHVVKCITVASDNHTFLVSNCTPTCNSAGGGKSFALLADPLRYCHTKDFRGILFRRTNDELRELIFKSKEMYKSAFPDANWSEKKSTWTFPSGAELWFTYLDRDDDVTRYQGQQFQWVGWDELSQWPTPFPFEYMRSRLRGTNPDIPLYVRCTANPGGAGGWWVKRLFVDPAPPGQAFWATDMETGNVLCYPSSHPTKAGQPLFKRRFIPAKLHDNPYLVADGQYEASLMALPESLRRQLLDGEWDIVEGAAFPEFRRDIHVCDPFEIPNNWTCFRSCDWGFSSKFGVLWFAVDWDNTIYIYREWYGSHLDVDTFTDQLLAMEEGERIRYGMLDSSVWQKRGDVGMTIAERMNRRGCNWRPSDRSRGSRVAGKLEIHRRLAHNDAQPPKIKIFANCVNLIRTLPTLPLDKSNPEDVDTKAEDHLYDALRYGLQSRPINRDVFSDFQRRVLPSYAPVDPTFGY